MPTKGHFLRTPNLIQQSFTMVTINLAYTAPINPPGASPVLTKAQVWAGLKRKVLKPYEFVPVIVGCEVISEKGNTVVREVTFAADKNGVEQVVLETCVCLPPCREDFQQENGSTISNIVSKGPDGELLMTFSFQWIHEAIAEGSDEEAKQIQEHENVSFCASNINVRC